MRTILLLTWLLIPIAAAAYHFGPGQTRLKLDRVTRHVHAAKSALAEKDWSAAQLQFEEALAATPDDNAPLRRELRLEICKVQLENRQLPEAHESLKDLIQEISADPSSSKEFETAVRSALANAQYYMTWLLRLEGQPRHRWEPEIEGSRQNYRWLAEQALSRGDVAALELRKNDLEAAIRLARMDLGELQGLPLPSQ